MKIRQITDFSQVELLYHTRLKTDFPSDELRSLASIQNSWLKEAYECYELLDDHIIKGYAFFVRRDRDYLLDYLAVAPEHRGEGLGSGFLRRLTENIKTADIIVCEVENPEAAADEEDRRQRERRLQFYLRAGFRKTELISIVFGVNYRILVFPEKREYSTAKLRGIYTEVYRSILPKAYFQREFWVS